MLKQDWNWFQTWGREKNTSSENWNWTRRFGIVRRTNGKSCCSKSRHWSNTTGKVKNIQEDSLDSVSSPLPSVKIQIMGRKVFLRFLAKQSWALPTNFWKQKVCCHHPAMFCLVTSMILIFTEGDWIEIHAIFLNLFYFKILSFGPKNIGSNILVKSSQCSSLGDKYLSSLIHGFQLATQAGPLCEEPLSGHSLHIRAASS